MLVHEAKAIARDWVMANANRFPGFTGAFFHGSINWLAADDSLPPGSDVDVMLVLDAPPAVKVGKFRHAGLLLEISHIAAGELASAEQILRTAHLAGSFHCPAVIADPTGRLTQLQAAVAAAYPEEQWVRARCRNVEQKIRRNLQGIDPGAPWHEQVTSWLFATGLTTHVLLVAGLQNPTVRKRYLAVRELLADYDQLSFHTALLAQLGAANVSEQQVREQLSALTTLFDLTSPLIRSSFFFASDLGVDARPIAIDGSRRLIEAGYHREAIFWIVATAARCQQVLHQDAPAAYARERSHFQQLLAPLNIQAPHDLLDRSRQLIAFLPELWQMAERIMAANSQIVRRL